MKSKVEEELEKDPEVPQKLEENETYDYEDSVDTGAPEVASSQGSKITLIAFSAVLISVVLYFLFFNSNEQKVDDTKLEQVTPDSDFSSEAPAEQEDLDEFNTIFGEDQDNNTQEDVILETPDLPSVPELPDIFGDEGPTDDVLPAFLDLPENQQTGQLPGQPSQLPNDQLPIQGRVVDNLLPPDLVNNPNNQGVSGQVPAINQNLGAVNTTTPSSIIVVSGAPGPTNSIGYEKNIINLNKDPVDELQESAPQVQSQYIKDRTTTIVQGKIITAVLETAINTETPGQVRGIISRNVYAESGKNILIPRGSRIYGSYSSTVARGQARVTINWTRLIRPDGVDATISFNAADQFGRAGIEGDVDNKYGSIITNSILTSVLAVGGAIAAEQLTDNDTSTTTTDPTTGTTTTTGSASNQAIYDVSKTIIDTVGQVINNTLDLTPVIRVPQGTKVTIVVNSDMSLPQFKK